MWERRGGSLHDRPATPRLEEPTDAQTKYFGDRLAWSSHVGCIDCRLCEWTRAAWCC